MGESPIDFTCDYLPVDKCAEMKLRRRFVFFTVTRLASNPTC